MKNEEIVEMNNGKKFDIILSNPPYSKGLGEKFLLKYIDIADKIISVQPLTWLLTLKQNKKLTNKIDKIYANFYTFNGFAYFDAGIDGQMAIQYIDNKKEHKILLNNNEYKKCEDIKIYDYDNDLKKIGQIKDKFTDFVWDHRKVSSKDNINNNLYCIKIPQIRGHIKPDKKNKYTEDFFTVISKNDKFLVDKLQRGKWENIKGVKNKNNNENCVCLAFNTEYELNNFISYLKSDFCRMFLLIAKTNINQWSNRCLSSVPWFDFSDEHFSKSPREIDDWLFKKYNISDEIRKHIEEILPDYYNIR